MDGLIIRKKWLDKILAGDKEWEIRSSNTKKRGTIALIEAGSGTIKGIAYLSSALRMDHSHLWPNWFSKHRLRDEEVLSLGYKNPHAWVLNGATRIKPIPYKHPRGAVIWVKDVL